MRLLLIWMSCLSCLSIGGAYAIENAELRPSRDAALQNYDFPCEDGLYATVCGYLGVKDVELKKSKGFDLKVPGFEEKMPVEAVVQKRAAPLVVVLLGLNGHTGTDFSKLWASWYADAGYHVLTFDSTFRAPFVSTSGHGVTGNLWAETERVAAIIDTFLKEKNVRGRVTKVGVVGMSYGGAQALILGRMAKDGKLPFELAGIQAYSPPLRMEWTAALLDRWYEQERSKYTLTELQSKFSSHKPAKNGGRIPFSESEMKAAISAAFREGLADLIVRNDEYFELKVLPRGDMFDDSFVRKEHAEKWGYTKFAFDMSLPYWEARMGRGAIDALIRDTQLGELLKVQPAYSEAIIAADDPFNAPDEFEKVASSGSSQLTILPRGGHLGYVSNPWTKAKLMSLFEGPSAVTISSRGR